MDLLLPTLLIVLLWANLPRRGAHHGDSGRTGLVGLLLLVTIVLNVLLAFGYFPWR
jgi:hypothetical protein